MMMMIFKKYLLETPMHKVFYIWIKKGKEKNSFLKAFFLLYGKMSPSIGNMIPNAIYYDVLTQL